jgi:uncharacterized surface protein with fasciclin (FAS1) repeats
MDSTVRNEREHIMRTTIRKSLAMGAVASLAMFSAACGSDEETPAGNSSDENSAEPEATDEATDEAMDEGTEGGEMADPAANLVGSGCAGYAEANPEGPASVEGMAVEPVATAASGNPLLKTLVAAVSGQVNPKVDLVGALNDESAQYTVFAPTDDAFAKIDAATLKTLSKPANADALSGILTFHVLAERVEPADLMGTFKTLNGAELEVTGEGDNIQIDGQAAVICGGVQTANATVYLIDTVMMPPAM